MEAPGDFPGERRVDHAMGFDPARTAESLGRDSHAKMTFPARPVAGVPLVQVGFVHHFQGIRVKSLG